MSRDHKPTYCPVYIRGISERVYRARLEQASPGGVDRMIAKDGDSGAKLRNRASSYDPLTRAYLAAMGLTPLGQNWRPA